MRRRGTSLIELLIVITLIGILTGIAAPRLRPSSRAAVEQNARLLSQDLDLARTRAYASRARVRMVISDTLWQVYLDQNRDSIFAESATEATAYGPLNSRVLDDRLNFSRGVAARLPADTISAPTAGPMRIQFGTRGITEPFGASAFVYLTHDADSTSVYAVEVTPAANVRVWRWLDGTWQ